MLGGMERLRKSIKDAITDPRFLILAFINIVWELTKDRLEGWANSEINTASSAAMKHFATQIHWLASTPAGWAILLLAIVFSVLLAHSYWNEHQAAGNGASSPIKQEFPDIKTRELTEDEGFEIGFNAREEPISLAEGCRIAYEKTRGSLEAAMAERQAEKDGDQALLNWYATWLTAHLNVPLYGARSPSTKQELIDPKEYPSHAFREGATRLAPHAGLATGYVALHIREDDLMVALKSIDKKPAKEENDTSPYVDPDWDIPTLVAYLKENLPACRGISTDDYDRERIDTSLNEIRKQACLGNIKLYGSDEYQGPPIEISKNYWEKGKLHASLITTRAGTEDQVTEYYISGRSLGLQTSYSDIHVSSRDAMKLWPKGGR